MFDHEPRRALDDPGHFEAESPLSTCVEAALHRVDRFVELEAFDRLGDVVDRDTEAIGHRVDHRPPDHRGDRWNEHRWQLVERLAEADHFAHDLRRVVGRVVEELLHADLVDAAANPAHQQRQDVLCPPGIDAGDVEAAAPFCTRLVDPREQSFVRSSGMQQPVDRRRDDAGAGPEARDHVVERVVGAGVTAGGVDHGVGPTGQHGTGVVGRDDTDRLDVGQLTGVAADLGRIADDHVDEFERSMRHHRAQGSAADVAGTPDDDLDRVAHAPAVVASRASAASSAATTKPAMPAGSFLRLKALPPIQSPPRSLTTSANPSTTLPACRA